MNDMRKLMKVLESIDGNNSCVGCKFLYAQDTGYSNYTVIDIDIECALNRNENLPAVRPDDWGGRIWPEVIPASPENDRWSATQDSRCERYAIDQTGEVVHLDIDNENGPADFTSDSEVIAAICADTGRKPHGGYER